MTVTDFVSNLHSHVLFLYIMRYRQLAEIMFQLLVSVLANLHATPLVKVANISMAHWSKLRQ